MDLADTAVDFGDMADSYRDRGHREIAGLLDDASRALLDAAFPNDAAETADATRRLRGVLRGLEIIEAGL